MTQKYLYFREEQRFHYNTLALEQTWMWKNTRNPLSGTSPKPKFRGVTGNTLSKIIFQRTASLERDVQKLENTWSTSRLLD